METRNFERLSDTNIGIGDKVILRNSEEKRVTRVCHVQGGNDLDDTLHFFLIEFDNSKQIFTYDDKGNISLNRKSREDIMQVNLKEQDNESIYYPHTGSY